MKLYKYDIAISLCSRDVGFGQKLIQFLNPKLKTFFYPEKQEELISKNGVEAFAKAFKEESRIVVIIHRKEWGESVYTEIEKNAIADRTAIKNEGLNFIFLIPLDKGEAPPWYPATRIYANPVDFSVEQLAKFVEFKLTELGGIVKPLTFEERMQNLHNRMDNKKAHIKQLLTSECAKEAEKETGRLIELFNEKVNEQVQVRNHLTVYHDQFDNDLSFFIGDTMTGQFGIEGICLEVAIFIDNAFNKKYITSQGYRVVCSVFFQNKAEKLLQKAYRYNKTNEQNYGWSEEVFVNIANAERTKSFVIFDTPNSYYYDLKEIMTTETLLDSWFTEIFKMLERRFNPVLL